MNKHFCHAQINRGHHLFFEHDKTVGEVADIMKIDIRAAWHLLRLVKQKFDVKHKSIFTPEPVKPKIAPVKKAYDEFLEKDKPAFVRPKAEYSNKNYFSNQD